MDKEASVKILFVCAYGRDRSRTAAELFAHEFQTRYKGLYSNPVALEDILWADFIFVMEEYQIKELITKFPEVKARKINCLCINDSFSYNEPELISLLKIQMEKYIKEIRNFISS
jgi:predicted protein tyrosine phosphatase